MDEIKWGIIGCGDVTEVKSGPGFQKATNSSLVAVMRRTPHLAQDYAKRHNVPKWYSTATDLVNDPDVNAIYVATPPSSHKEYALLAAQAGKFETDEGRKTDDENSSFVIRPSPLFTKQSQEY